jgi:bifunctional enzyme CysN/CysC
MVDAPGLTGRNYDIKLANQWASASITTIKHRININTLAQEASTQLQLNDISVCNLALARPLVFDTYVSAKPLGGFILVDRFSHATVAVGMIRHSLRRAQNVHRQLLTVSRPDRERLNGHQGRVIWFTGLSGSGKSTLANALEVALHAQGRRTYILDGDNLRQGLNKDLGFTDADRVENIRRVAEMARLMMDAGLIVLTAFISPFRQEREMARELIGPDNFTEVHVSTPLEVCEQRDVKGLYKKARNGQLPNMSGITSPYEVPLSPQITINASAGSVEDSVRLLVELSNQVI